MAGFMSHYEGRQKTFVTIQGATSGDGAHTRDRCKPYQENHTIIKPDLWLLSHQSQLLIKVVVTSSSPRYDPHKVI